MGLKSLLFVSLLIVAGLAAPLAEAQLGGIGGLVGGVVGLIGGVLGSVIKIQGTVYCSPNGNMGVNGTLTPAFPNAEVQLLCGAGNVVSTALTNSGGVFTILLDPLRSILQSLLSTCNLVVNTPLSTCNSSLSNGGILSSPLLLIGNTISGLLNTVNIIPGGFNILN